ncbi:MAG TPA: hypothetical protein VJN89_13460 [Candidatus Acidoferrum sp.]|nr:hypothetical protein [Candidatus Acidoferrum sp.]
MDFSRRQSIEHGFVDCLFGRAPSSPYVTERLTACNPEDPWPQEFRCMQGLEFLAHDHQNLLQNVIGMRQAHNSGNEAAQ